MKFFIVFAALLAVACAIPAYGGYGYGLGINHGTYGIAHTVAAPAIITKGYGLGYGGYGLNGYNGLYGLNGYNGLGYNGYNTLGYNTLGYNGHLGGLGYAKTGLLYK